MLGFVKAFNRHDAPAALRFFTMDPRFTKYVGVNDCDFRRGRTVAYYGRARVARWLRERSADHDRLTVSSTRLLGTRPAGVVVTYSRRISATLTSLGLADGIEPDDRSKVGLTTRGPVRITVFANAAGNERPCGVAPPASSFQPVGRAGCAPPSPANDTSHEARGAATTGDLWALFFVRLASPDSAVLEGVLGKETKIVWRLLGSGSAGFTAISADGHRVAPVSMTAHEGSTWTRPGDEWGTEFVFSQPGCWQIHAERRDVVGDLWLVVRS